MFVRKAGRDSAWQGGVEQHRQIIRIEVSDYQIKFAIAIEIADHYRDWANTRGKVLFDAEAGRDGARHCRVEQHWYIVGVKVRDHQVKFAVPVEIAGGDRSRVGTGGAILFAGKAGGSGVSDDRGKTDCDERRNQREHCRRHRLTIM